MAQLAAIGQELTAMLELPRVFACIEEHLFSLVHANFFGLLLVDEEGQMLRLAWPRRRRRRKPSKSPMTCWNIWR
ncbi:hypothetical protein V8J88_02480 [Massilia sp. W12]|uniref:hypothetical protein n=1 Tax=Massilia sp. W12 TaxID=3126507 RepID=UPI0030D28F38